MATVLVATPVLPDSLEPLRGHDVAHGAPGSDPGAQALICDPTQLVDAEMQRMMPKLRLIAVAGTGSDAVDLAAAQANSVVVLTAGEVLAETTADLAFGLIIAASRLMLDAEASLRNGRWEGWRLDDRFGRDVYGSTLGLVGFGRIGQAVARRAQGFDMNVLHHTRHPTGRPGWTVELDRLLTDSDVVSIHVPLSDQTYHLIDRRRIGLLRASSVLVNTARGAVVDEDALAEALVNGQLLAAGLDVYENEPAVSSSLLRAPRTVLLPHIGSATLSTRRAMLRRAAEKVRDFLAQDGQPQPMRSDSGAQSPDSSN
jgi:lactate dehydrogenase-like 2-hydroxyacid dehydrogenase